MKDGLNPARFDRNVLNILELLTEVRHLYEEAIDVGVWAPRIDGGRGSLDRAALAARDVVSASTISGARTQARDAARRAAGIVDDARLDLREARNVLVDGIIRTDPEVLRQYLEKRRAALG